MKKTIAIIIAAACLNSCAVVLQAPKCTAKQHNWTAWHTTKAADEFSPAIQKRHCTTCGWEQGHGQ